MFTFTDDLDLTGEVKRISGFHVAEDAATPAPNTVLLRNGSSTGDIIVQIELAADESKHFAANRALLFPSGLFVEVTGGLVQGLIVPA